MIKTTVGYAARELGISRQLVHIYIKKGLIRAERSGPARTAPYWLESEDVKALLGTTKLQFAHEQRARLLGKPKKKRAAAIEAAGDVSGAATHGAATVGAAEGPLG